MIKDTIILEKYTERWATKFILADYVSDYKKRLGILPLMYMLDLYDIIFFVKALQQSSPLFNKYHMYHSVLLTPGHHLIINHVHINSNYTRKFYLNRIPRIWNKLPYIDIPTLTSISPYQSSKLLLINGRNTSPQICIWFPMPLITSVM